MQPQSVSGLDRFGLSFGAPVLLLCVHSFILEATLVNGKRLAVLVLIAWFLQLPVAADDQPWPGSSLKGPAPGLSDYLSEVVLRPVGVVSNLVGLGLFVAASPVTLIASAAAPHDALANSFNGFVVGPYRYTFRRPLGVYRFPVDSEEESPLD